MYDPENALACFPVKRPNMLFYDTRPPLAITGRIFKIRTYNLDELFFIGSAPHASCSFQFLIMDRIIKRRGQTLAPSNPRVGSIPIESYKDKWLKLEPLLDQPVLFLYFADGKKHFAVGVLIYNPAVFNVSERWVVAKYPLEEINDKNLTEKAKDALEKITIYLTEKPYAKTSGLD